MANKLQELIQKIKIVLSEDIFVDTSSSLILEGERESLDDVDSHIESLHSYIDELSEVAKSLPSEGSEFYQYLQKTETKEGVHYLSIQGDKENLSDIMFSSPEDAHATIIDGLCEWTPEDAADFILVRVNRAEVTNPFVIENKASPKL